MLSIDRVVIGSGETMLSEIALTIGLAFFTVTLCLAVMGMISLFKSRRRRRAIERGVKDFVSQVRG